MGGAGQGLSRWVVATATWQSLASEPAPEDGPAAREGLLGTWTTAVSNSRPMRELEKGRREEERTGSRENWRGKERGEGRTGGRGGDTRSSSRRGQAEDMEE